MNSASRVTSRSREQAQGDPGEQLPVLILCKTAPGSRRGHGADDGGVDAERHVSLPRSPDDDLAEPPARPVKDGVQGQGGPRHRAGARPAVGGRRTRPGCHLGVLCRDAFRSASQLPAPPPMAPSAFSGPSLAPPISDTVETATIPGTCRGSTCSDCSRQLGLEPPGPGGSDGAAARPGRRPQQRGLRTTNARRAGPDRDRLYTYPQNLITPMNTRPAPAPNTPRSHRVTHQDPELPLLGDRRCRGRPG